MTTFYRTKKNVRKALQKKYFPFDAITFFDQNTDLVMKFIKKSTLQLKVNEDTEVPFQYQYQNLPSVLSVTGEKKLERSTLEKLEWIKCSIDIIYYCKKYITISLVDGGLSKLKLFDYQEDMINLFNDNRFIVNNLGRQLGKTTCVAAYIQWLAHFHENKQMAVLANKTDQAQEIMERIEASYEMLPTFIKPGCRVYNKRSLTFRNKSKIFSGPSSKSSIRGRSCVAGETKVSLRHKSTNSVRSWKIEDLSKVMEVSQVTIDQIYFDNHNYEVMTPSGWSSFDGLVMTRGQTLCKPRGVKILCTPDHKIFDRKIQKFVRADYYDCTTLAGQYCVWDLYNVHHQNQYYVNGSVVSHNCSLIYWDEAAHTPGDWDFYSSIYPTLSSGKETKLIVTSTPNGKRGVFYKLWSDEDNGFAKKKAIWSDNPNRDEKWKQDTMKSMTEEQFRQEFCGEFISTGDSLISAHVMDRLKYKNPLYTTDVGLRVFEEVKKDHQYFMPVDVSEGVGGDYHAFSVLDITNPEQYRVVATFRNNKLSPLLYPTLIHNTALNYNEAFVLVELNSIGWQVGNTLYYDLEYENLLMTTTEGSKQILGFSHKAKPGVKTSVSTKAVGCSNLKFLMEKDRIVIPDPIMIDEFSNFAPKGKSYEALSGATDDMVMTLVIFAWATTQNYFRDLTNTDIRTQLSEQRDQMAYSELTPFGLIDRGEMGEYMGDSEPDQWLVRGLGSE